MKGIQLFTIRISLALVLAAMLTGCGGGGGGAPAATGSSNWDEMTWDQDNWA